MDNLRWSDEAIYKGCFHRNTIVPAYWVIFSVKEYQDLVFKICQIADITLAIGTRTESTAKELRKQKESGNDKHGRNLAADAKVNKSINY
jgi:hypothetical protein